MSPDPLVNQDLEPLLNQHGDDLAAPQKPDALAVVEAFNHHIRQLSDQEKEAGLRAAESRLRTSTKRHGIYGSPFTATELITAIEHCGADGFFRRENAHREITWWLGSPDPRIDSWLRMQPHELSHLPPKDRYAHTEEPPQSLITTTPKYDPNHYTKGKYGHLFKTRASDPTGPPANHPNKTKPHVIDADGTTPNSPFAHAIAGLARQEKAS